MEKSTVQILQAHLSESLTDYFEKDAFFILGVSGGPDSMAMLYLFHLLEAEGLVVHVNYGKRGKQSDQDQELVEQMAFQWGFECSSIRLDPKEAEGGNFQNWAREQRYQFFRDLKADFKADAIVLAHHQDDQIETILQKVLRGSSLTAWQGMKLWDGELFRPFLPFNKQQILDFCKSEAVPYRTDKSNESSEFARNFIRNEFSDKMDELFPGWKKNVLALPQQGKSFEAAINVITEQVLNENTINLKKFTALPEILKPAILKTVLDQSGLKGEYSKGQLKELADIESLQTGKNLRVGNLLFTRDRDVIQLHPDKETPRVLEEISREEARQGWEFKHITLKLTTKAEKKPGLQMDVSRLTWPLVLRNWESGDAFTPLGMSGSQKISDHLTNRKIPTLSREKVLVLCGSDGTIYAILYPVPAKNKEQGTIAEMAKCTPVSQSFLTINFP